MDPGHGDLGPGVGETAAGDGVRVQGRPGSELPVAVLADGDGHAALRVGLGVGGHPPPARVRVVVRDLAAPPPPPLGLDEGGHRHGEELEAAGAALGLAVLRGGGAVLLLKRLHFWRIFLLLTLALRRKVVFFAAITTGLSEGWAQCLPDCVRSSVAMPYLPAVEAVLEVGGGLVGGQVVAGLAPLLLLVEGELVDGCLLALTKLRHRWPYLKNYTYLVQKSCY